MLSRKQPWAIDEDKQLLHLLKDLGSKCEDLSKNYMNQYGFWYDSD